MSEAGMSHHLRILWNGLATQATTVRALAMRELQHRYGRHNIGFYG
jgi:ABC-type polysaccharide/polyol phosphate export permease